MTVWHEIWVLALENYIFHGIVFAFIAAVVVLVLSFLLKKLFSWLFRLFKKIKFGKLEIETRDQESAIDPATPCPYADSKKRSMEGIEKNAKQIAENSKAIETLTATLKEMMAKVDDFRLDQLKIIFRMESQTLEERMFAGLKYVAAGGNSGTKAALIEMARERQITYNTIITIKPELRLKEIDGGKP
jgi:hypothetical protein